MMPYLDGYVLPIQKDKVAPYQAMASNAGKIWMKHGALAYFECEGEDLNPQMGDMKLMSFPEIMKAAPNETVIFAFIVFKSREHRDEVNAEVMADPEMTPEGFKEEDMPMDPSRMAYGGFKSIVHYQD